MNVNDNVDFTEYADKSTGILLTGKEGTEFLANIGPYIGLFIGVVILIGLLIVAVLGSVVMFKKTFEFIKSRV